MLNFNTPDLNPPDVLTPDQQRKLEAVFNYEAEEKLTETDIETLKVMFDTPVKLELLRKVFGVVTQKEVSFLRQSDFGKDQDVVKYYIQQGIDTTIKRCLLELYELLQTSFKNEKYEEIKRQNKREQNFQQSKRQINENF